MYENPRHAVLDSGLNAVDSGCWILVFVSGTWWSFGHFYSIGQTFSSMPIAPLPSLHPQGYLFDFFFEKLQQITDGADGRLKHKPRHRAEDMKKASSRGKPEVPRALLFFVFKPLKRWEHSRNVWFSQSFSTRMLTKLWLTKAYLSSMAMILSLLFSDWKPWQTFQWESSSKNC